MREQAYPRPQIDQQDEETNEGNDEWPRQRKIMHTALIRIFGYKGLSFARTFEALSI